MVNIEPQEENLTNGLRGRSANILISQQFGVRTHLTADVMDQADARVGMERCHLKTMGTGPAFWPLSYLPFLSRIHNKNGYCFFVIDVETPECTYMYKKYRTSVIISE